MFEPPPPGLPPDRVIGHMIPLQPDHKPPYRQPYRLSPLKIAEVKKQIAHHLAQDWIEESKSPYGASILFVQKKDGTLRMCVDYRALNNLTVKDRSPLPRIDDLLAQMSGATVFSSLDLAQGYHQIRIAEEDIPKTGFTTAFGHYHFKVMCFGLSNAPATFQTLMNRIFSAQLHKYVVVYLDDILIFSKNAAEHEKHLREVLSILRQHQLYAKLSKCDLNQSELLYLGHVVSKAGLKVDPKKVAAVESWPEPKDVSELRAFLGLTNYFRTFIQGYSKRVMPLTRLLSAKRSFDCDDDCRAAFMAVKHDLTHAPVLKTPDLNRAFELVADACSVAIGAVLLQDGRPCAFESRKLIPAELNYTTTEQECLAIIHALKIWRCYLEGQPAERLTLVTDHNPLVHLPKQPSLSRRMARWSEYLQRFAFQWSYRPGRINVADPVSRRSHDTCTVNVTTRCSSRKQLVGESSPDSAHPSGIPESCASEQAPAPMIASDNAFKEQITEGYQVDLWFRNSANLRLLHSAKGLWWNQNAIVIPDCSDLRATLLHEHHATPYSGHCGVN